MGPYKLVHLGGVDTHCLAAPTNGMLLMVFKLDQRGYITAQRCNVSPIPLGHFL